ncbi:MAG TPA: LCP family protein [Pseudolysinimonas sp.]|jgi:LCP family protein required for cell wall assembly|nr:LCP family protein [Pseudolysinimonas sp.]
MSRSDQTPRRPARAAVMARHGRLKRSAAWKAILATLGATLAVVLVAGSSVAAIAGWQLNNQLKENTVSIGADSEPPPDIAAFEGGFNILLVGSDTRAGQGGIGGNESSVLNDVTMLMHVAEDRQSATVVSFPRDLVVPLPACKNGGPASGQPINVTLYYGGLACTVSTVENLTGLKIQFAGLITFKGVIAMANAVGGVPVCFASAVSDPYTGLYVKKGTHRLKGANALAFLRSRHGVGDGSDLGRISSQQVFLSALVRQIKSDDTLTDFSKLYGIAQAATKNISLSKNFANLDTLVSVSLVLKDIPLDHIVFVQYPSTTGVGGIYTGKVAPIQSVADALFAVIKADKPLGLDADAIGSHGGSVEDPNAPKPSSTPSPSSTPNPDAPKPVTVPGVKGQTAGQYTCSQAYSG